MRLPGGRSVSFQQLNCCHITSSTIGKLGVSQQLEKGVAPVGQQRVVFAACINFDDIGVDSRGRVSGDRAQLLASVLQLAAQVPDKMLQKYTEGRVLSRTLQRDLGKKNRLLDSDTRCWRPS